MAPGRRLGVARGEYGRWPDRIGYRFDDPACSDQAMAHRSWCAEQGGRASNERLEFLGDAVLGLVVAEYTYRAHPELSDGAMSKVRASVVNTRVLAEVALELGIDEHLRLGRGEDLSGGRTKESILADATEAVIGAVYLDGGLAEAERLVLSLLRDRIAVAVGEPGESDHKSRLQEEAVRLGTGRPPLRRGGFRTRPCPAVPGHGVRCWPAPRHGGGALQEGRRAGRRPGRLRIVGSRERRGGCLSFPKSRPSGATSRERSSAGRSNRSRCATVAPSGAIRAPSSSAPGSRATRSRRSTGRASTCSWGWTTARPWWSTSG